MNEPVVNERVVEAILARFYDTPEYRDLVIEEACALVGLDLYKGVPQPTEAMR